MKSFVHSHAVVEPGALVGQGTKVWAFTHVMHGARIGRDCNIGDHCFIEGNCLVGDGVTVKNGVSLWDGVTVEDDVFIGPNAVFTNDLMPIPRRRVEGHRFSPTVVRQGACVGANATIVCGVAIGRFAFVGAGAVVTKDVPDFALVYGNPTRPRAWICECREKLKFSGKKAKCSCGRKYLSLSKNKIRKT